MNSKTNMSKTLLKYKGAKDSKKPQYKLVNKNNFNGDDKNPLPLDKFWDTISNNGVGVFVVYIDGKKVKVHIAVKDDQNISKNIPKFKYHIKNASGNTVSIKTNIQKNAQCIFDYLFGKNMYKASASL